MIINSLMASVTSKEYQTDAMESEEYDNSPNYYQTDRHVKDYNMEDTMLKFRIKLIQVNRSMTKTDAYYLHQQMRKHFPSLTNDIQEPHQIFTLLINHGYIGPHDTRMLLHAFFAMKRHDLVSMLTDTVEEPPKPRAKSRSRSLVSLREPHIEPSRITKQPSPTYIQLTDQFVYRFCNEEIGPNDLLGLAVKGFKIPLAVIQRAKYDTKNTLDATIAVFTYWKQQAPLCDLSTLPSDSMPPYSMEGLAKALKDAQLNHALRKYF